MKKSVFWGLLLVLLSAVPSWAVGTCTQTSTVLSNSVTLLEFTCTADVANGSYPSTVTTKNAIGFIFQVITNPGTVAPQDNYDITLTDDKGFEVTGSMLANRDTANTELIVPKQVMEAVTTYESRFVHGKLTLAVTGNNVNSATTVISVYISTTK